MLPREVLPVDAVVRQVSPPFEWIAHDPCLGVSEAREVADLVRDCAAVPLRVPHALDAATIAQKYLAGSRADGHPYRLVVRARQLWVDWHQRVGSWPSDGLARHLDASHSPEVDGDGNGESEAHMPTVVDLESEGNPTWR